MLETDSKNELQVKSEETLLPATEDIKILSQMLENKETQIVNDMMQTQTRQDLQNQIDLFNLNQTKKNVLRFIKLGNVMEKVEDQAVTRVEKRPDQIGNRELVEYMNAISNQMDKIQNFNDKALKLPEEPIRIIKPKTDININVTTLDSRDSKENVMNAAADLLKQLKQQLAQNTASDPIDAVEAEIVEAEVVNTEKESVYNNESSEGENN